jgi:hypothetical protein
MPASPRTPASPRAYTAAEVDTAIEALQDPERLRHAQEVVTHAAPALQRILAEALREGGWFEAAHDAEVARAAAEPDERERARAVATLVAEQTRLGMFVGAAVGFGLAHELQRAEAAESPQAEDDPPPEREAE